MTSPSEDRLRRAVDEILTVCWNEDIPLLDALGEALEDWMAVSTVDFGGAARAEAAVGGAASLAASLLSFEQAVVRCPMLTRECATADAFSSWLAACGD